ncbi:MAG TPA: SPFH domain-containing protein [Planctomycetaceae bacterium]|nr:SPFH domain-containing protein [Planctomycetaceae bacterium]
MTNPASSTPSRARRFVPAGMLALLVCAGAWQAIEWGYNRIYVPEGKSLLLRYKGFPVLVRGLPPAEPGHFARVNEAGTPLEIGFLERLRGPGRHFYCPLWWERELVDDLVIDGGNVGIVTCKMGDDLPRGEFLVDGTLGTTTYKGILRNVLAPGRYRFNPYAYTVEVMAEKIVKSGVQDKHAGWVSIPTGYVGVVTSLAPNKLRGTLPGIQNKVLQPGLYPVNPKEEQVDIIGVGFSVTSVNSNFKRETDGNVLIDESGEPVIADDDSGIRFPSNDGFDIHMDFTAVWGISPIQAPDVIRKFGTTDAVETKVVIPQIESICRNQGSRLGAVELLVGDSRMKFQENTSAAFEKVLQEKDLTLLHGLVRHIYIPLDVRQPIQESFIADEIKLTNEQKQITRKTEATLQEATAKVEYESQRIAVETEKLEAEKIAEGRKTAEETRAETVQKQAAIDRKTAEIQAHATVLKGEAEASAKKLLEQAKAQKLQLAVSAFGSADSYNQWVFATGLPEDMKLHLLYAGDGTFWTDLKGFSDTMLGRQQQRTHAPKTEQKSDENRSVQSPPN